MTNGSEEKKMTRLKLTSFVGMFLVTAPFAWAGTPEQKPVPPAQTPVQQEVQVNDENLDLKALIKMKRQARFAVRLAVMAAKAEGKDVSEPMRAFAKEALVEHTSFGLSLGKLARVKKLVLIRGI